MKKLFNLGGVMILAILAFSCQTEKIENDCEKAVQATKTYTFTVQDKEWTAEGDVTRTAYAPGTGLKVTGDELISLFYVDTDGIVKGNGSGGRTGGFKAAPTGTPGEYSFTGPDLDGSRKFYAVMPYSLRNSNILTATDKTVSIGLSNVQYPTATSFDPHFDFIVGRPFELGTEASSATVTSFKRLFSPLRINLTGLNDTDKIYAVSILLSQVATDTDNQALTGLFTLNLSESYEDVTISVADNLSSGNGLVALYPEGLSKADDSWPVWFIVNPIDIAAKTVLSLVVSTADKTYTRAITLPNKAVSLARDKFNELSINVKGNAFTERESFTQFFIPTSDYISGNNQLTASDGVERTWVVSGTTTCWNTNDTNRDNGSGVPNGLYMFTDRELHFPMVSGKSISSMTVYQHPNNQYFSPDKGHVIYLNNGSANIYRFYYNQTSIDDSYVGLYPLGGHIECTYPDLKGKKLVSSHAQNVLSAITLTLDEEFSADKVVELIVSNGIQVQWPFSTPAASTLKSSWSKATLKGTRTEFIANETFGDYKYYVYGSGGIIKNSKAGLVFGQTAGDYIEFPAIEGYKLTAVRICMGYANTNGTPQIVKTDGTTMVTGGNPFAFTYAGEMHTWNLSGTEDNTAYRLASTENVKMQIRSLMLGYTAVE